MKFKSRCYNGGGKHKFGPRYSERPMAGSVKNNGPHPFSAEELRGIMVHQVYRCDVCEWCGKVTNEQGKS